MGPMFYPAVSLQLQAAAAQILLAGAKVRLWRNGFSPQFGVTRADLVAQECSYPGYPAGGVVIAAFQNPIRILDLGFAIIGGMVQFSSSAPGSGPAAVAGGWWLETAAGDLYAVATLPKPMPFQTAGAGVPIGIAIGFGTG